MSAAGRLYFKHRGVVKAAIDPSGNFFIRAGRGDARAGFAGLVFRARSQQQPAMSVKPDADRARDGELVVANVVELAIPVVPSGCLWVFLNWLRPREDRQVLPAGERALVFKRRGVPRASITYQGGAGQLRMVQRLILRFAWRKDAARIRQVERDNLRDAIVAADSTFYPDAVSYWDKQDQIHQATHVHNGPAFVPWHRELVNRLEELLRLIDPLVSLHYWNWQSDPRSTSDGRASLFTSAFMGSASGRAGPPLHTLDNGGVFAGSRNATNVPADPPQEITRSVRSGAPGLDSDGSVLSRSDWVSFREALEDVHDGAHGYIGGTLGQLHQSFEDPFVYLLHSNVDRLWAAWQNQPGQAHRLDPNQVYGTETNDGLINENMEPWAGASGIRPWAPPDNQQEVKSCRHPTVVTPPLYV